MSANNMLLIKQTKDGKKFKVMDRDSESKAIYWVCYTRNLLTACLKAQEYMEENDVEYGCWFSLKGGEK